MKITKKVKVNTYNCSILFVLTNEMGKTEKYLQKKYAKGTLIPGTPAEEAEGITITVDGKPKRLNLCTRCLRTQHKVATKLPSSQG